MTEAPLALARPIAGVAKMNAVPRRDYADSRCPTCRQSMQPPPSDALATCACPSCGVHVWYVHVDGTPLLFDRSAMTAEEWSDVERNVPLVQDDSITTVEKVVALEGLRAR